MTARPVITVIGLMANATMAGVDSACCGPGGLSYALVAGFIVHGHVRRDSEGHFISEVEPISDPLLQLSIQKRIMAREAVSQVVFS